MQLLTRKVDTNIDTVLPDKIPLLFDGQTTPEAHYIALLAAIPVLHLSGFWSVCLALSPFQDETTHASNEQRTFFVASNFGKSYENVVALAGDHCGTNRCIATKL